MSEENYLIEAWNGIVSGRLKHRQTVWSVETSCGPLRCLAGWAIYLEAREHGIPVPDYVEDDIACYEARQLFKLIKDEKDIPEVGRAMSSPQKYCEVRYGLTNTQSKFLFQGNSKLKLQYNTLKSLYPEADLLEPSDYEENEDENEDENI